MADVARELNFAVQRTIDRLIFLRICEDRGIEHYAFLQSLMNGARSYGGEATRVYPRLVKHFRDAADGSQLTAYSLRLSTSDSGPSAVSRKPIADLLGQVYEQFLGKVIRLTAGHQANVEERSKDPVPTHALDEPSVPRKLSAMPCEPRPALTELFIMSPESSNMKPRGG